MRKLEAIYHEMGWNKEPYQKITELSSKQNKDSRKFCTDINEDVCSMLKRVFGIADLNFDAKYLQACSGSGQEERRIATLHSSSLCALLFFYNVTKDHPLKIYIDGLGNIEFYESIFEYQNCVIQDGNPSNIDITLVGERESDRKKAILFLESKFSEYITGMQKTLNINGAYLEEELSKNLYENWKWKKQLETNGEFSISVPETQAYLGGLKQMVSHYVGVRKFERGIHKLKNGMDAKNDLYDAKVGTNKQEVQAKLRSIALDGEVILALGTIIFDVFEKDATHNELNEYRELYVPLMKQLADDTECSNSKVIILPQLFTYQDIFRDKKCWITKEIYEYYFGKGKDDVQT